jgi:hypothetical protein
MTLSDLAREVLGTTGEELTGEELETPEMSRRQALAATGTALATGLAGCAQYPEGKHTLTEGQLGTDTAEGTEAPTPGDQGTATEANGNNTDSSDREYTAPDNIWTEHPDKFLDFEIQGNLSPSAIKHGPIIEEKDGDDIAPAIHWREDGYFPDYIQFEDVNYSIVGGSPQGVAYVIAQPNEDSNIVQEVQNRGEIVSSNPEIYSVDVENGRQSGTMAMSDLGGLPLFAFHIDEPSEDFAQQLLSKYESGETIKNQRTNLWNVAPKLNSHNSLMTDNYIEANWPEETIAIASNTWYKDGKVVDETYAIGTNGEILESQKGEKEL